MRLPSVFSACALALVPLTTALAQEEPRVELGLRAGIIGYQGDLQSEVLTDYGTRAVFGAFVRHAFAEKFAVRGTFEAGTLAASDLDSPLESGRFERGLSFEAPLFSLEVVGEWLPFRRQRDAGLGSGYTRFNPYGFVGVGYTHAEAEVSVAGVIDSEDYPEQGDVSDFFAIPVGGGLRYDFPVGLAVGVEGTVRTVISDKLDGITSQTVSSTTDDYYWTSVVWVSYAFGSGGKQQGCPDW